MEKYIKALEQFKYPSIIWKSNVSHLKKIESYIKGEITPKELIESADNIDLMITYYAINKVLNYKDRPIRYFIEMPRDMNYNIDNPPAIIAATIDTLGIPYDTIFVKGPKEIKDKENQLIASHYLEITGDFSSIPNGCVLNHSDWYRIICTNQNLLNYMLKLTKNDLAEGPNATLESVRKNLERQIALHSYASEEEGIADLPSTVINSIEFDIPKEYVTARRVKNGTFKPFAKLVEDDKKVDVDNKNIDTQNKPISKK